ncbi:MAG: nickel pincer cofactor biosynthesis protein LarC [Candidatus Omnitrophota bacterium]
MKIAYLDCFSGVSGDMLLGAFIDCGLKISELKKELSRLNIKDFDLKVKKVKRGHLQATKVEVTSRKEIRFSDLKSVIKLLDKSKLDPYCKEQAKEIFINLAKAEAKVHKESLQNVHFHQLGQLDTVIDIVGFLLAKKILGIEKLYASRLVLGAGMIHLKHAKHSERESLPLPAPAALELLKGRNVRINQNILQEVVTPTGAAIIKTQTCELSEFLPMQVLKVGYGAGSYSGIELPNVIRIMIAEVDSTQLSDNIIVIETNIDDSLPLNFELLFERLFAAGALDVYTGSIMMKKNRPGILLHVQVKENDLEKIISILFNNTTSIGLRIFRVFRRKLKRKILKVKSIYGIIVRVKIAQLNEKIVNITPEYEDCKKIAKLKALSFKIVYDQIKAQVMVKYQKYEKDGLI